RPLALTCVLLGSPLRADDLESLHQLNFYQSLGKGVTLQIHSRLRTHHDLRDFYQVRGGPIVTWMATPRLQPVFGYYYIDQEAGVRDRDDLHRFFAGGNTSVYAGPRFTADWRVLVERFVAGYNPDFTRIRTRTMFTVPGRRVTPIGYLEGLRASRIYTGRFGAGLSVQSGGWMKTSFGYELRQYPASPASHILFSIFDFQKPARH
ncbi:MAG: DUF2490 domain-containing protein, partial [Bryobacteraceae bacterium]